MKISRRIINTALAGAWLLLLAGATPLPAKETAPGTPSNGDLDLARRLESRGRPVAVAAFRIAPRCFTWKERFF